MQWRDIDREPSQVVLRVGHLWHCWSMKVTQILGMDLRTTTGARVFRRQIGGPINSESILLIYLI